jgi:hypothetical protein
MLFAKTFDGFQTLLGDTWIHVTEHFIGAACALPVCGERWFKKGKLPPDLCNKFLVPEHQDPDWSQGIHVSWIKEDWKGSLTTVQRYITGEGRFNIVHCYHLRFLMHLSGDKELNLPYYLLKSLTKMARRVQGHPESSHRSLYHQGLIKLLVTFSLEELEMPWDYFLKSVGLKEQEQVPDSQNKGDASEDKMEVRVSPEPGSSMKPVQPTSNKGKGPKTRARPRKQTSQRPP